MALFSMRVQVIGRNSGRSIMAAVGYRAGEKIFDARQGIVHDYTRRTDVVQKELLFPQNAPDWVQGINREDFWNAVDARENRKDAQTAREIRIMIPRELSRPQQVDLVRDFVQRNFVDLGMCADVSWHDKIASDGIPQPHAHALITMRPLTPDGFGNKVRHDRVPDPSGAVHDDGHPIMISSNPASWNCADYYERCREDWEKSANAALEAIGSPERIDRRSYVERGLSRMAEPMLGVAYHMKQLYGAMKDRFGQWLAARHFKEVEKRAEAAFDKLGGEPASPELAQQTRATAERFIGWFDRQIERLSPSALREGVPVPSLQRGEVQADISSIPDLER